MTTNTNSSKKAPSSTKSLKSTSTITLSIPVPKLVTATNLYLNKKWTSATGFLTDLVRPMWLYFLSTPFVSSTSSSEKEFPFPLSTTPNSDSTPSVRTLSSKKNTRISKKSVTPLSSPASTPSARTARPSKSSSTGQTTSSNQKPRKPGQARASLLQATGASSVVPKPPVKRARTSSTK